MARSTSASDAAATRERSDPAAKPAPAVRTRMQVINLIARGVGSREMANSLSLSVKTIESHRAAIKRKLGLATNAQLVQYAIQWHGRTDV